MKSPRIIIVDYGVGNLFSLKNAFDLFCANVVISEDEVDLINADAIVLPGDGSFKAGMQGLEVRGIKKAVLDFAKSKKPILGICLGVQIMLGRGYEFGEFAGLGLISGKVVPFPRLAKGFKIPHIGWNKIYSRKNDLWRDTILSSAPQNSEVYFVHSYVLEPEDPKKILALSRYGGFEFCAAIRSENIYGCQFHPEKSGEIGLNMIKNFVDLVSSR